MELLKGIKCSKLFILAFVTIALVSVPDQCEAVTCYSCPGPGDCPDETTSTTDCVDTNRGFSCYTLRVTRPGEDDVVEKGCNVPPDGQAKCFNDLGFGFYEGCRGEDYEAEHIRRCRPTLKDGQKLKYCVCKGDKCNGEKAFGGSGGGGTGTGGGGTPGSGGGGNSKASSLKWTATGAGLMMIMASILIATGGN